MKDPRDDHKDFVPSCPLPVTDFPNVLLGHGGGGKLTQSLIEKVFAPAFDNPYLRALHDGAVIQLGDRRVAFSTDSYVVRPLFFPGGDIGKLAVCGTVNDIAMCGARPLYLSAGFVIEEGLPMETLWRVVQSMSAVAREVGVQIVTGDTKVVDRGKGDGVYINTAGIGIIEHEQHIGPESVAAGDKVILSGDIGRHGMAIMATREGLEFENEIESDCMPLGGLVSALFASGVEIHCLRDLTRGGLAAGLIEIAESAGILVAVEEAAIPIPSDVRGACEVLGLDPLQVANEGRFVAIVPSRDAAAALAALAAHPDATDPVIIGEVTAGDPGLVTMRTPIGASVILDMPSGEQLPRIC